MDPASQIESIEKELEALSKEEAEWELLMSQEMKSGASKVEVEKARDPMQRLQMYDVTKFENNEIVETAPIQSQDNGKKPDWETSIRKRPRVIPELG